MLGISRSSSGTTAGVLAQGQPGLDQGVAGPQPELVEPVRLLVQPGQPGQVHQRVAPPHPQRRPQQPLAFAEVGGPGPAPDQLLRPRHVGRPGPRSSRYPGLRATIAVRPPSTWRRWDTWRCNVFTAVGGAASPHTTSMSRSVLTISPGAGPGSPAPPCGAAPAPGADPVHHHVDRPEQPTCITTPARCLHLQAIPGCWDSGYLSAKVRCRWDRIFQFGVEGGGGDAAPPRQPTGGRRRGAARADGGRAGRPGRGWPDRHRRAVAFGCRARACEALAHARAAHARRPLRRPARLPVRAPVRDARRRTADGLRRGRTGRRPDGAAAARRADLVVPVPARDAGARRRRAARGRARPGRLRPLRQAGRRRRPHLRPARRVGARAALFDALDLRDVTLVGQDWGGLIGLRLVAEHRDRFARVVAANTGLPTGDQPMPDVWLRFRDAVGTAPELDVARLVRSGCQHRPRRRTCCAALRRAVPRRGATRPAPRAMPQPGADRTRTTRRPRPTGPPGARLSTWDKPFLVAFSDGDPITGGDGAGAAPAVPGAQGGHRSPGAGHFLQEDAGAQLADAIARFVPYALMGVGSYPLSQPGSRVVAPGTPVRPVASAWRDQVHIVAPVGVGPGEREPGRLSPGRSVEAIGYCPGRPTGARRRRRRATLHSG